MDVSTDILNDPKFRKLARHAPDRIGPAFIGYIATLSESWKSARRVAIDEAWPVFLAFDPVAVDALIHVGLLDGRGMVPAKSWRSWFDPADERRRKARDRWARYNAKRDADAMSSPPLDDAVTASEPRGSNAGTATSVPVRTVPLRSEPSEPSGATESDISNSAGEASGARVLGPVQPRKTA